MIVGNPAIFAIESHIETAYVAPSLRGVGYFVIRVNGQTYGVHEVDATMLAVSFDEVERRIAFRGGHKAPFGHSADAGEIAVAFIRALYCEDVEGTTYLGLSQAVFSDIIYSNRIMWAPDGDTAFDDRSYVLQFDLDDFVRLVAFKRSGERSFEPETLTDCRLPQSDFYGVLESWRLKFSSEWAGLPKANPKGDWA